MLGVSDYGITLIALLVALAAQSLAAGVAFECALRRPLRLGWLALALAAFLIALEHGYSLELALHTGIYDLRQALLGAVAGALSAGGILALRGIVKADRSATPPLR